MKKSKLCKAIAMAAALGGLGAGLYASTASAVNLSPTGVGDVVLFPYYTVRDGWQTTLTFVNTSDNFLAVKFRFMEGVNSRDVLDFNVVMSPYDVYTGVVEANGSGGARFRIPTMETTCTAPYLAPNSSFDLSPIAYTGVNADGGPSTVDRVNEGYVMAMVMGSAKKSDLKAYAALAAGTDDTLKAAATALLLAEHPNTAADCAAVQNLFALPDYPDTASFRNTARLFGEPINVLKGNYSLLNAPRGTSAGGNAITLSNFFNTAATDPSGTSPVTGTANPTCTIPYSAQFNYHSYTALNALPAPNPAAALWTATPGTGAYPGPGAGGCPNLLTPQVFPFFLEPSLNDAYGPVAARTGHATALNNNTPLTLDSYDAYAGSGFQAVSEVLRARTATNEWSVNPNLGVATNWVVTQPTKSFFVDDPTRSSTTAAVLAPSAVGTRADVVQAAINKARFDAPVFANLPLRPNPTTNGAGLNPYPVVFSRTTATTDAGKACVAVGVNIWDRDELSAAVGGVTPSPIEPTAQRQLCYETTVLNFNPNGQTVFSSSLAVDVSADVQALWAQATAARPAQPFGWLRLDFTADVAAQGAGLPAGINNPADTAAGTTLRAPGLPAVGFMMRERIISTTNVTGNYGDLANHSYTR